MPFYEYRCQACGHEFEEWQSISAPSTMACSKCGAKKAKRLISKTSFQLRGSGWYVTDYKGAKSGNGGKSKSGKPTDAAAKDAAGDKGQKSAKGTPGDSSASPAPKSS